jgi:RES domain-containing protein
VRLRGLVYRVHNPRWAFAPTSGEGARRVGGRFNAKCVAALYTSLHVETAWLEAQQGFARKAQPMTMCAYAVDCEDIADLTDPAVMQALSIAPTDLRCGWKDLATLGRRPPSWDLADRLIASGHAGILVHSFATGATEQDVNAIFWRWSDAPPHQVRVIDDTNRLPRNDRSWR